MGLRGPGAKPVTVEPKKRRTKKIWERKTLTRAGRVIAFIESLRITSGIFAGKPFKLRDWQRERIINPIYATENNKRIVRQALVTLPRKNGKTQLVAALALCHLCGPESEQRGQVFSAAADRDQAALIYNEMVAFIEDSEYFSGRIIVRRFQKQLEDTVTGSTYQALSSDARKAHGLSPSFVVCDELSQWRGRELYDNLLTGTGARAEPLSIVISTQSADPNSVMQELVGYGKQVNSGVIDDRTFHAVIYEAPIDAEPFDESVWHDCNPALGDFRSIDEMRAAAAQASRIPARLTVFKNLYLNQPVEIDERFISRKDWEACAGAHDAESLRGRPCYAGLDLSSTRDLTALILYFPFDDGAVLPYLWVPQDNLVQREELDKVPYRTWHREGWLLTTPGRAISRLAIVLHIAKLAQQFDIQGIAYDRWHLEDLNHLLADEGLELPIVSWGQGFKDMAPAVDALETAILRGELHHPNNPVLTWNIANVAINSDPTGARKMDKSKARERIDGAVALTMAVGLYHRNEAPKEYDFSGTVVIEI